jgi:uncharacterized RDD family membrane protein YckC
MSDEKWHYARGEDKFGPMEFPALIDLVEKGSVTGEDLVWKQGMNRWLPARDLAVFSRALTPATASSGAAAGAVNGAAVGEGVLSPVLLPYEAYGFYPKHAGYGGFMARLGAVIIDAIVMQAITLVIVAMLVTLANHSEKGRPKTQDDVIGLWMTLMIFVGFFVRWLYPAMMIRRSMQATLGKMVFGLKVTDVRGNQIGFWRATGREFSKFFSALPFCLGYFMVEWNSESRALHDYIAGTIVVYKM